MNWEPAATAGIEKNSRVTPDGHTLLFASELSPTNYDNEGHTELYRYSAPGAELSCVSCDPSGSPAGGDAFLQGPPLPVTLPPARQIALTHNLSDDGDRIFFVSPDALVPRDTNGRLRRLRVGGERWRGLRGSRRMPVPDLHRPEPGSLLSRGCERERR